MRPLQLLWKRLFRIGRAQQLPIILTQRRIFIVPTRTGLLFSLVLIVMLIGAINYNLGLGHALVFLLAGLGIVAMVHTFRNLVTLRLTAGRAEPVFAGEIARFPVHLENSRNQARRALEFCFGKEPGVLLDISAKSLATVSVPIKSHVRGRLDPGHITLSTRYPLGHFHAWSYPHPPLSCLVYPRPLDTPLPASSPALHSGQQRGDSGQEDFTGLRLRQASDPTRHIAWKAVARDFANRPLLVKQFAGGATEELWLDWTLTATGGDPERRLSILTGWVLAAEERQARYGLRLPTGEINIAQGKTHRDACLEALALYGETAH
jgi:uncharacterized protein (DUF58 family)